MSTAGSKIEEVSGTEENLISSSPTQKAFDNHLVVENIISQLGDNQQELMKFRSVTRTWNDVVVRKINKSGSSFQIPLRYGSQVPKFLVSSEAKRWAVEILENVMTTLAGNADKIQFDTVIVDRDFFLSGVNSQWTDFLENHGKSIHHLIFKIRPKNLQQMSNHVIDCESVVSMENLRTVFISTPNLESLDFCVRFNYFGTRTTPLFSQRIFDGEEVPQLQKLSKIRIQEPIDFPYARGFLKDILSMAPHLTSFYIKPSMVVRTFCRTMQLMKNQLKGSLTSLGISGGYFLKITSGFPYLHLTTLEVNNIRGSEGLKCVEKLIRIHHSNLVTVILGNKPRNLNPLIRPDSYPDYLDELPMSPLTLPPVMANLRTLEVNLNQFQLLCIRSYQIQFPVLERLTLSLRGTYSIHPPNFAEPYQVGSWITLMFALDTQDGPCQTLRELTIFCRLGTNHREFISRHSRQTFPSADHYIIDRM